MSLSSDMFDGVGDDAVAYYPETLGRLASEEGIWHAAEQSIRRSAKSSALCVVMFHAYDLCDEASWQQLAALLNYCKKNANIRLHTFESLRAANVDGSCTRYEANKLEHLLQRYLLPHGVLHPTWVCYAALAGSVVCYWALLLLAVQLAYAILSARWQRIILLLLAIVGGVGLALAVVFHAVGPLKLLALDALVSLLLVAGASVAQAIYRQ